MKTTGHSVLQYATSHKVPDVSETIAEHLKIDLTQSGAGIVCCGNQNTISNNVESVPF